MAKRAALANNVARHIRSLANTIHGPPPKSLRKAILTCVIPVATYGAEAWYAGPTKTPTDSTHEKRTGRTEVSTQQEGHLAMIDRVLKTAIKAVLPVWKTTPRECLYRDAGIPTARILLEKTRLRFAHRLKSVDKDHPLLSCLQTVPTSQRSVRRRSAPLRPRTRLQHAARLLPDFPRPLLTAARYSDGRRTPIVTQSKEDESERFRLWLGSVPDTHTVVFSDGSKTGSRVGYGYTIYRAGKPLRITGCGRLGEAEVFDAEAEGALHGLKQALRIRSPDVIHVCIDNTAVINGLRGQAPESSQATFLEFQQICETRDVQVRWVPGHTGIQGNEEADVLAKNGAKLPLNSNSTTATSAGVLRLAKTLYNTMFHEWWSAHAPRRYAQLRIKASLGCPPELELPRRVLQRLLAARSGHGDFHWYHARFNHLDTQDCSCGQRKNPQHMVFCRKTVAKRDRWPTIEPEPASRLAYWRELVLNHHFFEIFAQNTGFFDTICPQFRRIVAPNYDRETRADIYDPPTGPRPSP